MQEFQVGGRVETRDEATDEEKAEIQYAAGLTGTVTEMKRGSVRWANYPTRTNPVGEQEAYDDISGQWHDTDGWEIMYAVGMDTGRTIIAYQHQLKAEAPDYIPEDLIV